MNKGKKAIKVVIAILIAAVAFGYGGYTTMRPGVYVGDDFFYEKSSSRYEQDASNYIEQTSDHEFTVVSHDKKQEISYEIEKEQITFYFPDQTVSGSWDTDQKELYDNGMLMAELPYVIKNPNNESMKSYLEKEVRILSDPFGEGILNSGNVYPNVKNDFHYKGRNIFYDKCGLLLDKIIIGKNCDNTLINSIRNMSTGYNIS